MSFLLILVNSRLQFKTQPNLQHGASFIPSRDLAHFGPTSIFHGGNKIVHKNCYLLYVVILLNVALFSEQRVSFICVCTTPVLLYCYLWVCVSCQNHHTYLEKEQGFIIIQLHKIKPHLIPVQHLTSLYQLKKVYYNASKKQCQVQFIYCIY